MHLSTRFLDETISQYKILVKVRQVALYLLITLFLFSILAWGVTPVVLEGLEVEVFEDALSFMTTVIGFPAKVEESHYFGPILPSHPTLLNRDLYLLDESFLI